MSDPVYFDFNLAVEQVAITIKARAGILSQTMGLSISQMLASGMGSDQIVAALKRDLREGGPIFSGFKSAFTRTINPTIDNIGQGSVYEGNPDDRLWEWVTTSADPCDDCEPRHGEVKAYGDWVEAGLPRSGFSVCKENCKCILLPKGQAGESIKDGPVRVDSLATVRAEYQEQLKTDPELRAKMDAYRASLRRK